MDKIEKLALVQFLLKEFAERKQVMWQKYMDGRKVRHKKYVKAMHDIYDRFVRDVKALMDAD